MKRFSVFTSTILLMASTSLSSGKLPYKDSSLPVETRVRDLLSRMTPEEKVGQLVCLMGWEMYDKDSAGNVGISEIFRQQNSGRMPVGGYWAVLRADPWTQKTLETGLSPKEGAEALNMLQRFAVDSTRLGIPILFAEECPHGHMAVGATVFPTGLAMAGTWNRDLIKNVGKAIAVETRSQGAGVGYGPVLDVARDPRWSRMEETFGEDPFLTGEIGVAFLNGMQGDTLSDKTHIASTLKHFAAYGTPEGGHNGGPANFGERILLSEYLHPFRKAVRNGAASVMTSYNSVDGIPCSGNHHLLTDILRNDWGFDGMVYSDLFSIDGMAGTIAENRMEAGAIALNAGLDVDLGGASMGEKTLMALEEGLVLMEDIDRAVENVLRLKFRLGLFDDPYVDPLFAEKVNRSAEHRALALQVAREGTALLKNDGILPLKSDVKRIAVIGPNADNQYNQLGDYTSPQDSGQISTVLEGIKEIAGKDVRIDYVRGCAVRDTLSSEIDKAVRVAGAADVAVVVLGGSSARDFRTSYKSTGAADVEKDESSFIPDMDCGEGFDRATLRLLGDQEKLLSAVIATGTPVVAVYIQGRPLDMNLAAEKAAALMTAWYPGESGGKAVAEIIFGKVNPSGKIAVSIPRSESQIPVYYSQIGARDYMDLESSPLFPFGHGLSYTEFEFSDLICERGDDEAIQKIGVSVRNTGDREGAEVVQLYVRDRLASVVLPQKLLKGFEKVVLKPGESKRIEFFLTEDDLAIYDKDMFRVVEPGDFDVFIGSSSADIRLSGSFNIPGEKE